MAQSVAKAVNNLMPGSNGKIICWQFFKVNQI